MGLSYVGATLFGPTFKYNLDDPFSDSVYRGLVGAYVPQFNFQNNPAITYQMDGNKLMYVSRAAQDLVDSYVLLNLFLGKQLTINSNATRQDQADLIQPYLDEFTAVTDKKALLKSIIDRLNAFVNNIQAGLRGALTTAFNNEIAKIKLNQKPLTAPPSTPAGNPVLIGYPDKWAYPGGAQFYWTAPAPWTDTQVLAAYNALKDSILKNWGIDITK